MGHSVWKQIQYAIERISKVGNSVSATTILVMMLLTVVDVTLRKFGSGIPGAPELNSLLLVVIIFLALAHCWNKDGHIRIDLFVDRFSPRVQSAAKALAALIGLCFFGAMFWGGIPFAINALKRHEVSTTLKVPLFPVKLFIVIGCSMFCFQLLVSSINFLHRILKKS